MYLHFAQIYNENRINHNKRCSRHSATHKNENLISLNLRRVGEGLGLENCCSLLRKCTTNTKTN